MAAAAWLVFFYAYCLRVRVGLGRLPVSIAEHAGLNGSWHHRTAWNLLGAVAWVTMVWSAGVVAAMAFSPPRHYRQMFAALLVPWSLWAFVNWVDPGGWFEWFLD